jgi:hypothetical protein
MPISLAFNQNTFDLSKKTGDMGDTKLIIYLRGHHIAIHVVRGAADTAP